jgi:hypothetical protein
MIWRWLCNLLNRTQLFICCYDDVNELTDRMKIAWGQQQIRLAVVRGGAMEKFLVFDRSSGGNPLLWGFITMRPNYWKAAVGDSIIIDNITWSSGA